MRRIRWPFAHVVNQRHMTLPLTTRCPPLASCLLRSGDATAVSRLTTTLSTNFTGDALQQQVGRGSAGGITPHVPARRNRLLTALWL